MIETRTNLGLHCDEIWLAANLIQRKQNDRTFKATSLIGSWDPEISLANTMTALDVARIVTRTAVLVLTARGHEMTTAYEIELREWARSLSAPVDNPTGERLLRRVLHLAAAAIRAEEIVLVIELELIEEEVFVAWDGSGRRD